MIYCMLLEVFQNWNQNLMLWDPPGSQALDSFMFSQVHIEMYGFHKYILKGMEICHVFTCAFNCKSDGFVEEGGVRPRSAKV